MKKRQLWDRGFRQNSSLQAASDTSIARTTGFEGNKIWHPTKSDGCRSQGGYGYTYTIYFLTYIHDFGYAFHIILYMNIQPCLLIRTSTHVETLILQIIYRKKKSRIGYTTRYQRPGTTNHPRHLGTYVTLFLPQPQHLKNTLINTMPPPPPFWFFFCVSRYGCDDFCLHLV